MSKRTPKAEEAILKARQRMEQLISDPAECVAMWEEVGLPLVAPETQTQAREEFRHHIQDQQFRLQFAIWCFQGTLKLYDEGALD